jgi:general secretion pathway protein C
MIGLLSVHLALGWHEYREDSVREAPAESVLYEKTDADRKPLGYYSVIEERNLFGEPPVSAPRKVEREAASAFRLRGTVLLDSGGGYAILENLANGAQMLHRLGDRVGDFSLVSIKWGRVVLKGSGGEKVLAMVSQPSGEESRIPRKKDEIEQVIENKRIISRSFVKKTAANANQILTQVRVRPHFVSGVSEGYWVGNIQPGSIIEEMGFRNGDIIKKVNGQDVNSPEKLFQLYQEIHEAGLIVIDVERGNQIKTLTYEIRD